MGTGLLVGALLGATFGAAIAGGIGGLVGGIAGAFVGIGVMWVVTRPARPPGHFLEETRTFPCAGCGQVVDTTVLVHRDSGEIFEVVECSAFHPARHVTCAKGCKPLLTSGALGRKEMTG